MTITTAPPQSQGQIQKPARPRKGPARAASNNTSAAAAGAGAALAPYQFDEAQMMTCQSLKRNVEIAQTALDRFLDSIRITLPNNGQGWILRGDQKGFDPPRVKAAAR